MCICGNCHDLKPPVSCVLYLCVSVCLPLYPSQTNPLHDPTAKPHNHNPHRRFIARLLFALYKRATSPKWWSSPSFLFPTTT